jgi:hypothetical protein
MNRSSELSLPFRLSNGCSVRILHLPHARYMYRPAYHPNNVGLLVTVTGWFRIKRPMHCGYF